MQSQSRDDAHPTGSALDILDGRFARGEIDKDEHLEKTQLISERASSPNADQSKKEPDAPKAPWRATLSPSAGCTPLQEPRSKD